MKKLAALLIGMLFAGGQLLAQSTPPTESKTSAPSSGANEPLVIAASDNTGATKATDAAEGGLSAGAVAAATAAIVIGVAVAGNSNGGGTSGTTGTTGTTAP
jgi:hypothetical protein